MTIFVGVFILAVLTALAGIALGGPETVTPHNPRCEGLPPCLRCQGVAPAARRSPRQASLAAASAVAGGLTRLLAWALFLVLVVGTVLGFAWWFVVVLLSALGLL